MNLWEQIKAVLPGQKAPAVERRRMIRLACKVLIEVRTQKSHFNAAITDISVAGVRIEYKEAALSSKDAMVSLALPGSGKGPVVCKVVWTRRLSNGNHSAGLAFQDTDEAKARSWVQSTLTSLGFSHNNVKERRVHLRVRANLPAYITNRADDVLTEGTMVNLGKGGSLVVATVEVTVGTRCKLRLDPIGGLPAFNLPAVVRSCRKDVRNQKYYHGLRFDVEDEPAVNKLINMLRK